MKTTIKEFAESQGVDVILTGGFLRFLEAKGMTKIVDHRKSESGKGKPSGVYEVSDETLAYLATSKSEVASEAATA